MKKVGMLVVALALVGGLSVSLVSAETAKPEKKMIIGDVIELSTFAMLGHSEDTVDATKARIEQGFPVAILEDETGDVYIAVYKNPAPASKLEKGNEHLAELAGKKVVVNGLVYEKDGVKVIRMSLVSEY